MKDFLKSLFPEDKTKNPIKLNGKQKKFVLSLAFLSLLGVFFMSLSGSPKDVEKVDLRSMNENQNLETISNNTSSLSLAEKSLEKRLEKILSMIDGAGDVVTTVTLDSSSEYEYAINTKVNETEIDENVKDGSTRLTNEKQEDAQLVMKNLPQGKDEPVIVKEKRAPILGIMVVAEGANDLKIRERLSSAVQTLLNVPAHRVMVLPKGK